MVDAAACVFCAEPGGVVLWRDPRCRVVLPHEPDQPGLCRVVLHAHVAELSDLADDDAIALFHVLLATERALRKVLAPTKINLASLGNLVPHLHWHVIPRWRDDRHFPRPIWAEPLRPATARVLPADLAALLARSLGDELGTS